MIVKKNEKWLKQIYDSLPFPEQSGYALISMKIKRFRVINRIYGRDTGNELIQKLHTVIESHLNSGEYIAHIYLGYFNLLLKSPALPDDETLLERISELDVYLGELTDEEHEYKIFCGYGIYKLTDNPVDFYTAQYNADICRSDSFESSYRNSHVEIYGSSYHDQNLIFPDLQQMIRPAINNGELKLYLQPKVDLKTGEITHAEALVRWISPSRGMIPLNEFLPALEENGLIDLVDLFIFEQVCKHIEKWIKLYGKKIHISVNLSRCSFNYWKFLDDYIEIFEQYSCPRECIEIELLESIVLDHVERVKEVVEEIRNYGFFCSLDDFGSGYSAYSVLTYANLSTLKIDRSLFSNYNNPKARSIIKHIIQTAHELDMTIVAEGIETKEYVDYLREIDCDYIQGFYFYRPMPADEFEEKFLQKETNAYERNT